MRRVIGLLITGLFLGQLMAFEQVYAASRAVIKSGSEYDYPPFCVVAQDGKADGFSVELLRAALSVLNLDVEFKTGEWDTLKKALSEGTIQVLPLVGRTPEREAVFDFTFPYLTLHGAVFVRKGDNRIKSVTDLADKTVLVMKGDNAEEFARRTNISSNIVAVETYTQAMQMLEAGKYDAVIAQRLMGIYLLDKIKIKKVAPLDFDLKDLRQDFCFAVREGDRDLLSTLNEGLSIVIANGTFDRLHKKWFGPLLQEQITFVDVVKYVLIVFVLTIIAMTLILIVMLRREVKRKTRSLVQEIAERKQAEEGLIESEKRLKREQDLSNAIIDSIPGTFYMLDESGRYARWNSYQRDEIVGKPDDLMTVTNAADTIHPDDRALIGDRIVNVLRNGIVETVEGRVLLRGGPTFRWLLMTGRQMKIDDRPFLVGIGIDITEHKRMREETKLLEERLQRSEKMESLGTLAGGVAHDLNNVLGIVVGYAELILESEDASSSIKPHLVNIMNGSQKAAAIVDDLLTLARRGVSGKEVLNLNKIIADCQQSPEFEKLYSYHPAVKINTDLESDQPNITCSSVHLGKSLYNLVSNACEAMPKGGIVTIKTTSHYLEQPLQGYDEIKIGDYVVLSVSDTGQGINNNDLKRIFEPFYTKKAMGRSGTGLGLAVVWGTVKDHHGYINVQSEEGKGSTFTIYFPATREDITTAGVPASISEYMGKGESVLVVDDVKEQRDLAVRMLRTLNYSVSSAESGEEAVEYLKKHQADLIVLDMIMDPGMDGLDTYRSIIEIHPKQKAIIVSGFSESDRVHEAQGLGAGAYVKKPYVKEKLGVAVRKDLDRK